MVQLNIEYSISWEKQGISILSDILDDKGDLIVVVIHLFAVIIRITKLYSYKILIS